MQAIVRQIKYVVGFMFLVWVSALPSLSSAVDSSNYTSLPAIQNFSGLSVLFDPVAVSDALFQHGCSERVALRNAISSLLCTRIDNFLSSQVAYAQITEKQYASIKRMRNKLSAIPYNADKSMSVLRCVALVSKVPGFEDIVTMYSLFQIVDDGDYDKKFLPSSLLAEFPFEALIDKVPHASVKQALQDYKNNSSSALFRIINTGTILERQSAMSCCFVMLLSMCEALLAHYRSVGSCINLIQIYEQVEQLPIENALQAIHCLLHRVGVMLASLNQKEEGFVGWLKNKWVYLPVAVIIIAMRIAKYYWGSQGTFGTYFGGNNHWGGYGQTDSNSLLGSHSPLFETRIEESNSTLKNAEVVVGSA